MSFFGCPWLRNRSFMLLHWEINTTSRPEKIGSITQTVRKKKKIVSVTIERDLRPAALSRQLWHNPKGWAMEWGKGSTASILYIKTFSSVPSTPLESLLCACANRCVEFVPVQNPPSNAIIFKFLHTSLFSGIQWRSCLWAVCFWSKSIANHNV